MKTGGPRRPAGASRPPTRRIRVLVSLYPRAWQVRYGAELQDLLEETGLGLPAGWDLLRGALDARLHRDPAFAAAALDPSAHLRRTVLRTLTAWLGLCIAACGLAKATEDPAFTAATNARPALWAVYHVGELAFLLACVAMMIGALALAAASLRQAIRRRDRRALLLLGVPPAAAGLWSGGLWLLAQPHATWAAHPVLARAAFLAWLILGLTAAAASVAAFGGLLRRTTLSTGHRRAAVAAQTAVGLSITVAAAALASYGLLLRSQEPALFYSDNGIMATPLPLTWFAAAVLALVVAVASTVAAVRAAAPS